MSASISALTTTKLDTKRVAVTLSVCKFVFDNELMMMMNECFVAYFIQVGLSTTL